MKFGSRILQYTTMRETSMAIKMQIVRKSFVVDTEYTKTWTKKHKRGDDKAKL